MSTLKYRKIYGSPDGELHLRNDTRKVSRNSKEVPVEQQMSPERLRHLHNCIHFTHTHLREESSAKMDMGGKIL